MTIKQLGIASLALSVTAAALTMGCIADLSIDPPAPPSDCDPQGLDVLLEAFPPCDLGMCGPNDDDRQRGRCVDVNQVPEGQRELLGACGSTSYPSLCVPTGMLIYDGRHKPEECTSLGGLPGRCTSLCVPQVQEQGIVLPQDVCLEDEKCAPCYDPTTFEPTGACSTSHCDDWEDDGGPDFCAWDYDANPIIDVTETSPLEACPSEICDQPSHCMPNGLVPENQRDLLPACDADRKCVPDTILASGGNAPSQTCTSIGGAEGRCQSTCIPEVRLQMDMLPADICNPDTERCAPCYDPVTGETTGACETACDMPTEPPYAFENCCDNRAKCVPEEVVPEEQASNLTQQSCDDGHLCAPTELTDPSFEPPTCMDFWGQEGVCLSTCIPTINALGSTEPECPANTKCILCEVLWFPTGACDI